VSEPAFAERPKPATAENDVSPAPGAPAERVGAVRPSAPTRPAGGRYVSGRGITGRGIVALIAVTTFVGGLADLVISGHRSFLFAIAFVITSALGAFVVRRRDLPAAMIAPPLIYCVLIVFMSVIDQSGLTGGLATREGYYIGNAFVTGAPTIWIGTAVAAAIGYLRLRRAS
jgi:hypothetical protein